MRLAIAPWRLRWDRAQGAVTQMCSVIGCGCAFTVDDVPLRMWKPDGSAIALCDACAKRYVRAD